MFDDALMEDLKKKVIRIRPHGFGVTSNELADECGFARETARNKLNEMVKNGELVKEEMIYCKSPVAVYYKPKSEAVLE